MSGSGPQKQALGKFDQSILYNNIGFVRVLITDERCVNCHFVCI